MPDLSGSNILFLDNSFVEDQISEYTLCICLSRNNFNCLIYSEASNSYLGLVKINLKESTDHDFGQHFREQMHVHEWLSKPFKKTYILIGNPWSTLIPKPLFEQSKPEVYLKHNLTLPDQINLQQDYLKNHAVVNVFAMERIMADSLDTLFPSARILHFSTAFIEAITINYKNQKEDNSIYLNVREGHFDLLYLRENRLEFYNLFRYRTKEDLIYFSLAALEQLSMNPEETRVVLMGHIDPGDRLYEMVSRYIRHVEFIPRNENFGYAPALDELPHHHYYVLYNLLQCVS